MQERSWLWKERLRPVTVIRRRQRQSRRDALYMDERADVGRDLSHDAFISYSRKDKAFAQRLERSLEGYRPPRDLPVAQRHLDVFRDEEDFVGTEYSRAVDLHLTQSNKLIVICSPAARASRYVDDEIQRFLRTHAPDNLIPVLLHGIPNNEATSPEDAACAFPRALCDALEIPLAADFRGIDLQRDRLDRGAWAGAWFSLLANLYGQSRALIEQRETRRLARKRRITAGIVMSIIAALSVALVVSLVFRQQAIEQRNEAVRQRAIAEREAIAARRETAERLAVQAVEKLEGAPEQAVRLGIASIESFRRHRDPLVPASIGALQKAVLAFGGGQPVLPQSDATLRLTISGDLHWAAQSDERGNVRLGAFGSREPQVLAAPALPTGARWLDGETHLVFGGDHLIAMRPWQKGENEPEQAYVWAWKIDSGGVAKQPVLLDTFTPDSWSAISTRASVDGRWVAWTDGWVKAYLRPLAPEGATLQTHCGTGRECQMGFTADSRWFVASQGTQINRFELPAAPASAPVAAAPIEPPLGAAPVRMALFSGHGPLRQLDSGEWQWGEVTRLASLAQSGAVWWCDLTESQPTPHELPSVLDPYRERLELSSVSEDHVESTLTWSPNGGALLATVKHDRADFGIAAINIVVQPGPWQPLWHRYDGKAFDTSSELSGSVGGAVRGYRVKDSADLGVQSAVWVGAISALTLGFDGTVWWRDLERLAASHFQLVTRDAAAIASWGKLMVIGGRNGRLQFWSVSQDPGAPGLTLNGHDGPLREIRIEGYPPRVLSVDARGVARSWNFGHPILATWLGDGEGERVMSANARWLATAARGEGLQLWSADGVDSLGAPQTFADTASREATLALDPAGRWAAALTVAEASQPELRLRLWSLEDEVPLIRPPVEHRFPLPKVSNSPEWSLRIASDGDGVRAILSAALAAADGAVGSGPRVSWVADSRNGMTKLIPIGGHADRDESAHLATPNLRWLLLITGSVLAPPKRYHLVDLGQPPPQDHFSPLPLPANATGDYVNFSDDGRWMRLGLEDYKYCVLQLAAPGGPCIETPRDNGSNISNVLFGRNRAPMAASYEGRVFVLKVGEGRFAPVPNLTGCTALAWDPDGAWLATWSKGEGTRLHHIEDDALSSRAVIRLPVPPGGAGEVERLFPFPSRGWVAALTEPGELLLWHRDGEGRWEPPIVLTEQDLRLGGDWVDIDLRDEGRSLVVGEQVLSLDPDRLMRQASRFVSGR